MRRSVSLSPIQTNKFLAFQVVETEGAPRDMVSLLAPSRPPSRMSYQQGTRSPLPPGTVSSVVIFFTADTGEAYEGEDEATKRSLGLQEIGVIGKVPLRSKRFSVY